MLGKKPKGIRGRERSQVNPILPGQPTSTSLLWDSLLLTMALLTANTEGTNLFLACQWERSAYTGEYFHAKFTWKGYRFKPGQSSYCRGPVPVILGKEGEFPLLPLISHEHSALSNHFLGICQSPSYLTGRENPLILCTEFPARPVTIRTYPWAHAGAKKWPHSAEGMQESWF